MPTVTATAARSTPPPDLNIPRTDAPQRQRCHDRDEGERCEAPAPRRNPLVAAMMQALGSLMPSSKTTAAQDTKTAATDSSATAAAATPDASSSLKDAAMAFAHELFNALRSTGSGRDGGDSASESGRVHGHGHHHHGHGRGYGDLAQRLERLASEVAAPAKPAEPAQPDSAALSITASLTTAAFSTTSDSADGSSTTSVSLTTVNLSLTQQTAPADAAKESPLLSAFRKLFDALQPAAGKDAAKPDAASGLASFLRQLAQSLRGGQDEAATALPTQGSLISVAA
jgi:hypothetical protein